MSMFSSNELYYHMHTPTSVVFGYLFTEFDELINFEKSLVNSILKYARETKKIVETETFLAEEGDYIFEIVISDGKK